MTFIKEKFVIAKKYHGCDASRVWNNANCGVDDCHNADERLILEAAEADGWKIKKGDKYFCQTNSDDGIIYDFKARIDMHNLCLKHDLYNEI